MLNKWFGPSKTDRLFDLMQSDRRMAQDTQLQQTMLLGKLVESVSAQSQTFHKYLEMISASNTKTEVRVMTDADQAQFEQLREKRKQEAVKNVLGDSDPLPNFNIHNAFEELKTDMFN